MTTKQLGLLFGSVATITMVWIYEPVAVATSTYGNGGAGETSVQQTGGGGITRTSVVITGPKVLAPSCPVFESANGFCP